MKRNLLVLSLLLLMVGCNNVDPTTSLPSVNPSVTTSDTTLSQTSNTSDTLKPTSQIPTTLPKDEREDDYHYEGHIQDVMPRIDVTTPDGSNDFATKYDRNDKLAGKIDYVDCTITTSNCDVDYILEDVACEIKVRGNYTLNYAKKPLRLKFNKKQKMLGLNNDAKCKSWVLLADWKDRGMLNNSTAFLLGQTILGSDGYYTSDYRQVEVYLNGQYWGVYLLAEQQQFNEYRMDEAEPEDDYEGTDIGYLLEYDNKYIHEDPEKGGDYTFECKYNDGASILKYDGSSYKSDMPGFSIKSDITSTNQVDFIKSFINNTYKVMYNAAYNDEAYIFNEDFTSISKSETVTPREAIESIIDVQSLVDMYIISEIACDADVAKSSFYMDCSFEEGNFKKLTFEAPWDYDSAFGIKQNTCNSGEGIFAGNSTNPWLTTLLNEDWFKDLVKAKWAEVVKYKVLDRTLTQIETITTKYENYYKQEFERWPGKLSMSELTSTVNSFKTQKAASEYMTNWLKTRYNFINTVWGDGAKLFDVGGQEDNTPNEEEEDLGEYTKYHFEAEDRATRTGSMSIRENANASNGKCLGDLNHSGNSATFTITSDSIQQVKMYLGVARRNATVDLSVIMKLYVNDVEVKFPSIILEKAKGTDNTSIWFDFYKVYITDIDFVEGDNIIKLVMTGSGGGTNIDYLDLHAKGVLS